MPQVTLPIRNPAKSVRRPSEFSIERLNLAEGNNAFQDTRRCGKLKFQEKKRKSDSAGWELRWRRWIDCEG